MHQISLNISVFSLACECFDVQAERIMYHTRIRTFFAFRFRSFAMLKTHLIIRLLGSIHLYLPAAAPPAVMMFRKCPLTALCLCEGQGVIM